MSIEGLFMFYLMYSEVIAGLSFGSIFIITVFQLSLILRGQIDFFCLMMPSIFENQIYLI